MPNKANEPDFKKAAGKIGWYFFGFSGRRLFSPVICGVRRTEEKEKMNTLHSVIMCEPGKIIQVLTKQETCDFEQQWMNTFCKKKQGAHTAAYKWHIFSYGKYPSVSGNEALAIYFQHEAPEYIILPNDHEVAIATDMLPKNCNLTDYYVFPKNLAWTMAFTHEDGWLGPYFARHPDYEALNQKNIDRLLKNKAIENARQQGWC